MQFSVKERALLLTLLPQASGSLFFVRIIRKFREALSFSEQEALELNIKIDTDRISWDYLYEIPKEIEVGPQVYIHVQNNLQTLIDSNQVTENHLGLIDKFFPEPEP